ncbi:ROK family protein [Telmatocola sphagniphila]|uniref:ROK family protein n=1 Tax=Telmatocola sphagniphila TaxID=1123043 RepID=A0A8E6B6V0_9BACT|nr:ROK family protein [Telmatocola sphagniphila]QVL32806.1 ROK family protein [Telmatocola sphagniphila]
MSKAYFVGLDVGGTTMKAAVVDSDGLAGPAVVSDTESYKGQDHGLATMCDTIRKAVEAANKKLADIAAIGVATPGTMDIKAGLILDPPNLKPWRDVPVRDHILNHFKIPTAFQNDANAAAFGEYWVGAGRTAKSMVLFTLGTGVGGGIIINDYVLEGEHSHGGEIGHLKIEMTNGRRCGCGRLGCLEAYASATAVVKRCVEALEKDSGHSVLRQLLNKKESELTSRAIFTAAEQGDTLAQTIVEDTAYYLAVGAINMMHTIDPDAIVFAGGMIAAGESFLNRIRYHICELAFPVPASKTEVRYALLGSDAGFIGAAACARQLWLKSK